MSDTDGSGYIRAGILLICVAAVLSLALFYASALSTLNSVKKGVNRALEGTVLRESVLIYSRLDDGNCEPDYRIYSCFDELFGEYFSGLEALGGELTLRNGEGKLLWTMNEPLLYTEEPESGEGCALVAEFIVRIPVFFAGEHITDLDIPMTLRRGLGPKY